MGFKFLFLNFVLSNRQRPATLLIVIEIRYYYINNKGRRSYGNGSFKATPATEYELPGWAERDIRGAGMAVMGGYAEEYLYGRLEIFTLI